MSANTENVGIAMALVVGAGASTGLGAAVVFFPSVVKLASRRVLAASLGFSAGVMIYVSFVEIFSKSRIAFLDAGNEENIAHIYATACFFGGVLVMMVSLCFVCMTMYHFRKPL
jgi:ZIP family zinc transporter